MNDEKLEFSAQDLGRMGRWLGIPIKDVRDWLALQDYAPGVPLSFVSSEYERVILAVAEGYLEE